MVNVTHKLVYVSMQHYYMLIFFSFFCVPVDCLCIEAFVGSQLSMGKANVLLIQDPIIKRN